MTTEAETNAWRAKHLRLSAERLDRYIARLQSQAAEYRAVADRIDPSYSVSSNARGSE